MKPNIIVIGASAGGIPALGSVLKELPTNLRAAVLIVQHTSQGPGRLAEVLGRKSALAVAYPADGETIKNGRVYVAPPDLHMLLEKRKIRLVRGPHENRHRPGIDALFRSAAVHHRERVIGVILTGALNDGTSGLLAIKNHGGLTVVQDPATAEFPYMPKSAVKNVKVDYVVQLQEIPGLLAKITQTAMKPVKTKNGREAFEAAAATGLTDNREQLDKLAKRSTMICPTCKGALWEIEEKSLLRFRCHIGHAYTAEGLMVDQENDVELALSHALRALEDRAYLAKRLAQRARERKHKHNEVMYQHEMREAESNANLIRRTLASVPINVQVDSHLEP